MASPGQGGVAANLRRGAHKITFGSTVCGYTMGNVQMSINPQIENVFVNEFGQTPVDIDILGFQLQCGFTMPENSLKILDVALNGLYGSEATANARTIGRSGIQRGLDRGAQLTLHPISRTDTLEDIVFHKAVIVPTGTVELSDQGHKNWEVMAHAILDDTRTSGDMVAQIYQSTAS